MRIELENFENSIPSPSFCIIWKFYCKTYNFNLQFLSPNFFILDSFSPSSFCSYLTSWSSLEKLWLDPELLSLFISAESSILKFSSFRCSCNIAWQASKNCFCLLHKVLNKAFHVHIRRVSELIDTDIMTKSIYKERYN